MEFLFDTANLDDIQKYGDVFPYTGVTTNPSIIKAAGRVDFWPHMKEIHNIIGLARTLHVQTLAENPDDILREAELILRKLGDDVYVKIPTTSAGLTAMQALKKAGVRVTATGIYTVIQGYLAAQVGADYLAPYYNRMENQNIDAEQVIANLARFISRGPGSTSKIVAASFKNMNQVTKAISAGSHAITVDPKLLNSALEQPFITKAVKDFKADWVATFDREVFSEVSARR